MKAQSDARKRRLAAALRANLRRRKAAPGKPQQGASAAKRSKPADGQAPGPEAATNRE